METDESGLPVHLKMGVTWIGEGPVSQHDPDFDHWGCWCADPACMEWLDDAH